MSTTIDVSDWRIVLATARQAVAPGMNARTLAKRTGSIRFMGMSATPAASDAKSA